MNEHEPVRRPAGGAALPGSDGGVATRLAANTIETLVVGGTHAGRVRRFRGAGLLRQPAHLRVAGLLPGAVGPGFLSRQRRVPHRRRWINGQTIGDRVMGVRVVIRREPRPPRRAGVRPRRLLRASSLIGLMWCAVSPRRLSVQDLVLRTLVVYDWRPHATGAAPTARSGSDPTGRSRLPQPRMRAFCCSNSQR